MKINNSRLQEKSKLDLLVEKLHAHAYIETLVILFSYLLVGWLINPDDICILNGQISYILILLSVITLFHGFETGLLSISILAIFMWFFYSTFQYVEFLTALMMTLIYGQFHYYWTRRINDSEISSEYKSTKLDELSKSFYALRISHDQLEKNYVIKPMSLRNTILQIKEL